jgi:hypothetical protein
MGENGALWGGECLRVNYRECEHLGGLPAVALPGGDLAARQPWRNLLAHCLAFVPTGSIMPNRRAAPANWPLLARAIERGINAPQASSCGRLFDAVACALGCAPDSLSYEGEAACRLEALAAPAMASPSGPLPWRDELDLATFWQQWLSWQATRAKSVGLSRCAGLRAGGDGARLRDARNITRWLQRRGAAQPPAGGAIDLLSGGFYSAVSAAAARRRWRDRLRSGGRRRRPLAGSQDIIMIVTILRQQPRAAALVLA